MKTHGGDIYGISEKLGIDLENCFDFSANINPLGIPVPVKKAMEYAIAESIHYPDPECRRLVRALADKHSVKPEYILCGNGGADIIYRIVYAAKAKKALLPAPTFLAYGEALEQTGTEIISYRMDESLEVREDILELISEETEILFLCNPNNPTGLLISQELLKAVLKRTAKTGTRLIIDECFLDFVTEGEQLSMLSYMEQYDNLVIIKSFTKLYAIPGIRLGYALSSDTVFLQSMRAAGQPWPVNSIAVAAGLAALKEKQFVLETGLYVSREREWLGEELKKLGLCVYDGQADYLFFQAPGYDQLYDQLLKDGIIIRTCANYENLSDEYYRVAIKRHEENLLLVRHLKEILHAADT